MFETPELLLEGVEQSVMTMQCKDFATWSPGVIPKCIGEKSSATYQVPGTRYNLIHVQNGSLVQLLFFFLISAINCTADPPIALNDERGVFDWDSKNKSYTLEINYKCLREGWGFPSTGENKRTSVCQSNRRWSIETLEACTGEKSHTWARPPPLRGEGGPWGP